FLDDVGGGKVGILDQGQRGRLGVGAARAHSGQAVFGLQDVAVAGQYQCVFLVGHDQHGFKPAQHAVGAPVFGQFDGGTHKVALMLFQLGFEAFLQGEGVGRGTGESCQDPVVVQAADLACGAFDDDVAQGDLAIAAYGDVFAAANTNDGGSVKLFHVSSFEAYSWG